MNTMKLDIEEQDILESFDRGEWKTVTGVIQERKKLQDAAKKTLRKDARINIRMSSKDLSDVQVFAAQEGIPYQTLISSIIHKFVSGRLTENKTT